MKKNEAQEVCLIQGFLPLLQFVPVLLPDPELPAQDFPAAAGMLKKLRPPPEKE